MTDVRNLTDSREQTKNERLENRMLLFAAEVIRTLDRHKAIPHPISTQLTRSAASIGSNYAEACNASSKLDFRNKIYIAKKEAAETRYWVDLCIELSSAADWQWCRNEAQQLLLILQTIINTLRSQSDK